MYALLFDRRSLIITGTALAGMAIFLFAAGFIVGALLAWERELVPPRWLKYGPLAPDAQRVAAGAASAPPLPQAPASPAPGPGPETGSGDAAPPGEPAGVAIAGGGRLGAEGPDPETDGWVPFARPGEVEELLSHRAAEAVVPTAEPAVAPAARVRRAPAAGARSVAGGGWYVQTGAFSVAEYAQAEERSLQGRADDEPYTAYLQEVTDRGGRRLTAVRLGPFPSRAAAEDVAADFDGALVGRREAP